MPHRVGAGSPHRNKDFTRDGLRDIDVGEIQNVRPAILVKSDRFSLRRYRACGREWSRHFKSFHRSVAWGAPGLATSP